MDRAQIETQGGRGGNGCVSFEGENCHGYYEACKPDRAHFPFMKADDE